MSAEPGALPAAALEQVIRAVRDLDIDEVRGKIARREAEGPATRPDRGIRPGRQTALLRVYRRGPAKYAGSARSFSLVRAVVPGVLRVRVGHWRVLYAVDDDRRAIWIQDVRCGGKVHGGH